MSVEMLPLCKRAIPCYYFELRINWDKLIAIDQQGESFKAQIFFTATLRYPKTVLAEDERDVVEIFSRVTVENLLSSPDAVGRPALEHTKTGNCRQPWRFNWLVYGDFAEEFEMLNFPFDMQELSMLLRFGWSL